MKTIIITTVTIVSLIFYGFTTRVPDSTENKSSGTTDIVTGAALFQKNCAACHGTDLNGHPPAFPSLKEVKTRMTKEEITTLLKTGRNNMPSFSYLSATEREALAGFLYGENTKSPVQTKLTPEQQGRNLFAAHCARCHKAKPTDLQPPDQRKMGMQPPVLAGVTRYLDTSRFAAILNRGPCYMPSFNFLDHQEKSSIYVWLKTLEKETDPNRQMMPLPRGGCRWQKSR